MRRSRPLAAARPRLACDRLVEAINIHKLPPLWDTPYLLRSLFSSVCGPVHIALTNVSGVDWELGRPHRMEELKRQEVELL